MQAKLSPDQQNALVLLGWNHQKYEDVASLYQKYMDGWPKIVQLMHAIWEKLLANGGAYKQVFHHSHVGVHFMNRDKEGLAVDRVHRTPVTVKMAGFANQVCEKDTYAFEDNPLTQKIGKFTERLTSMSPKFGSYKASDVKIGSCGASHLNNSFQAADQKVPCDNPAISVDGRMSKEKIVENDPAYAKAFLGLEWKVIRYPVEVLFPALPELFQSALNGTGQSSDGHLRVH